MIDILEQSLLLVVSLTANLLSAIAGGGAGLLQLPALIFLGLPFSLALTTHKIASVALGLGASAKHLQNKTTSLQFAAIMLASGLPGVIIGARCILAVPENVAKTLLGLLTIALGLYSVFKKQLGQESKLRNFNTKGHIIGALGLFSIGFVNGSLTSGTGLFVTLWLISWYGFDYKQATAYTMIIVGFFWNGTGALTLSLLSDVKWDWLPMLLLGSLVGGYLGASIALKYGNPFIKRLFEAITILVGISLLIDGSLP